MFEAQYQKLSNDHPEWGRVALLPWDMEIFEFPVADYQLGDCREIAHAIPGVTEALTRWAAANQVELIGCSVRATDMQAYTLLPVLGLTFIDYTLKIYTKSLHLAQLPHNKIPVRSALTEDRASVERIAESAFRAGRYHADPLFPRELVNRRYKQWLSNAYASLGPGNRLYVTGEPGAVTSFFHVTVEGEEAYITIIAVDPAHHGTPLGIELCAGTLRDLQASGVKRMSSKISALNSGVMNFVNYYGWRFGDPQVIFHWHAANAPHLVPWESIYE